MHPTTIGLDLAKHVFQVHAVAADGKVLVRRKLRRSEVRAFFAKQPPCLVGIEACASAHHWARELSQLGHTVRLMPATYVKAYVKRGKSDAIDAEAICEAVTRPTMRFVPVKSVDQQAIVMLHRTRDLLVRQRTMLANALRGHLAEFGLVAASGLWRLEELVAMARATPASQLPELARQCIELVVVQLEALAERISAVDRSIPVVASPERGVAAPGNDPRHWRDHGNGDRGVRDRYRSVPIGAPVRGLAWVDPQIEWHGRQGATRPDLQGR
jgi:transposase